MANRKENQGIMYISPYQGVAKKCLLFRLLFSMKLTLQRRWFFGGVIGFGRCSAFISPVKTAWNLCFVLVFGPPWLDVALKRRYLVPNGDISFFFSRFGPTPLYPVLVWTANCFQFWNISDKILIPKGFSHSFLIISASPEQWWACKHTVCKPITSLPVL